MPSTRPGYCSEYRCPLVGGDTVAGPVWMLSITALGEVPRGRALLRSGARPGDRLLVTGALGGAALGLALLECGRGDTQLARAFVRRQIRPNPPYAAGAHLVRTGFATAAIDLSDGLAQDLGHLLRESGVAAEIQLDRLPLARGMRTPCAELGLCPESLALHGGEDYELLFCVRAGAPAAKVFTRRLGCRVSEIGVIRSGRGARYFRAGLAVPVEPRGFQHFKPTRKESEK